MENPHTTTRQEATEMQLSTSKTPLKVSLKTEIVKQKESENLICEYLLSVWVSVRLEILQMQPSLVPTKSEEEMKLIGRFMRQYGTITVAEYAECIRLAAIDKMRDLSQGLAKFPTLYAADFEEQIQKMTIAKIKQKESNEAKQLPKHTGGNEFAGEPSEVLARWWPKIVEQTKMMRTINPKMRDRFWYGGSPEQRDSAVKMLRQMIWEMNEAGKWDLQQHYYDALAIFATEFFQYFPQYAGMTDGMKRPLCPIQVGKIRQRLQRLVLDLSNFPDIDDCKYCAVFDAYWKFKNN